MLAATFDASAKNLNVNIAIGDKKNRWPFL